MKKKVLQSEVVNDNPVSSTAVSNLADAEKANAGIKEKKGPGFFGVLFSVIFSIILAVSIMLLFLILFIDALNKNVAVPDISFLSNDWLSSFFDTPYPIILGSALALIQILIIVLINKHRIRRVFLSIGCSTIASSILCVAAVIIRTHILRLLSGEWQHFLINTTDVFKDFGHVYTIILAIIGITCLSIYSCIVALKGDRHEKNA